MHSLGMEYLHYGVGGTPLADPGVAGVCDFIDRLTGAGGKVLVHCRKGSRGMALVLIQQARLMAGPSRKPSTRAARWAFRSMGNSRQWSRIT